MTSRHARREQALAWLRDPETARAPRVKLCGMFRADDVAAVCAVRPDFCGFIVDFPKSHRSVTPGQVARFCEQIDAAEEAAGAVAGSEGDAAATTAGAGDGAARSALAHPIWRVGVVVDRPLDEVARLADDVGIDFVQLHGHEDAPYVDALRARTGIGIIQAFRLREPADAVRAQESHADLVLLDNGQGTGATFDWSLVRDVSRPFLLAGGLDAGNVEQALGQVHPWGADVSSGIETDRLKDPAKMAAVVLAVRRGWPEPR